jgi:hypothetical protein
MGWLGTSNFAGPLKAHYPGSAPNNESLNTTSCPTSAISLRFGSHKVGVDITMIGGFSDWLTRGGKPPKVLACGGLGILDIYSHSILVKHV